MLTLLEVGDTALPLDDFFLILMPGIGAELRASKKPVHSMAEEEEEEDEPGEKQTLKGWGGGGQDHVTQTSNERRRKREKPRLLL